MNKITLTAAVLLLALSPLSPAAFAGDRNHGGDRHGDRHDARPGHHYGHGHRHNHYRHYRHNHRYGWDRRHNHGRPVARYGHNHGVRVVLPAPPLPVILPPHLVLKHMR